MNEKTNSVAEMVEAAHEQAVKSGFWDDWRWIDANIMLSGTTSHKDMAIAQKLALISTEVMEFHAEAAKIPRDRDAMLEELADVVIRIFDLSGFLGEYPIENIFDLVSRKDSAADSCAIALFNACAGTVQSHRKGQDFASVLHWMIVIANGYSTYLFEDRYALRRAVEAKMEKNRSRQHKHGAAY